MNPNQLEQRIAALEKWQQDRIRQQITFPLDTWSQTILNKYFLSSVGFVTNTGASGQEFGSLLVQQNNKINIISVLNQFITYTANTSGNLLTLGINVVSGNQGSFSNGQKVAVNTGGTAPTTPNPATPPPATVPLTSFPGFTVLNYNATNNTLKLGTDYGSFDFTSNFVIGATSGTLVSNWTGTSGSYVIAFTDNEQRTANFTNGSTSVTWSSGLTDTADSTVEVYQVVIISSTGTGIQYIYPNN